MIVKEVRFKALMSVNDNEAIYESIHQEGSGTAQKCILLN